MIQKNKTNKQTKDKEGKTIDKRVNRTNKKIIQGIKKGKIGGKKR